MDKHLNILKQLMMWRCDKDKAVINWDLLNDKQKLLRTHYYIFFYLKYNEQ